MSKLLTREEFNKKIKQRDKNCLLCNEDGEDVHHIIERKLFEDGGYYLRNGVFVCAGCHWKCETTEVFPIDIWKKLEIENPPLPDKLNEKFAFSYDKWGNIRTEKEFKGKRIFIKGPMYETEQVQKILNEYLKSEVRQSRFYLTKKQFYQFYDEIE